MYGDAFFVLGYSLCAFSSVAGIGTLTGVGQSQSVMAGAVVAALCCLFLASLYFWFMNTDGNKKLGS
jgi:hypothetical protein